MEMEIMFNFNTWIIVFGSILAVYRICDTVEKVVETKEISKYSKVLEYEYACATHKKEMV